MSSCVRYCHQFLLFDCCHICVHCNSILFLSADQYLSFMVEHVMKHAVAKASSRLSFACHWLSNGNKVPNTNCQELMKLMSIDNLANVKMEVPELCCSFLLPNKL